MADSVEKIKLLLEVSGDTKLLDKLTGNVPLRPKVDLQFSKDSIKALENLDKLSTKGFNAKLNLSLSRESSKLVANINDWASKGITAKVKLEIDKDSLKAIENLDKLKEKGFGAKFGLNIDKDSIKALENLDKMKTKGFDAKLKINIDKSSGGDYQKIEKLRTKGIEVKTSLKLTGKDYQFLKKLKDDGMLIKVRRSGPSESSRPSTASSIKLTSQEELNEREVARLNAAYLASQRERRARVDRELKTLFKNQEMNSPENLSRIAQNEAQSDARYAKRLFDITQSGNKFTYESPAIAARKSQLSAQTLKRLNDRDIQRSFNDETAYNSRLFKINQSANLARQREAQKIFDEETSYNSRLFRINQSANLTRQRDEERQLKASLRNQEKEAKEASRARKEIVLGAGLTLLEKGPLEALGSLAGGVVGNKFGPSGALAGSALGGGLASFTISALEKFTEGILRASEAGRSLESSILGIASVLQATTTVRSKDGSVLGTSEELKFQQSQATKIQKSARARLLPLGISGEREATLVQAIIAGAAQRGIQLDGEQAATLAERLGGAIQAQRPELLNNSSQLRRDIEDLLSGLPNRTVLSSLVKGFAPGLGKATSAEQLLRASSGLASFPESLKESKDNPIVAFQKFNASIDQFTTSAGDALNKALIPALNTLSEIVGDPNTLDGISSLSRGLGELVSTIITSANAINKARNESPVVGFILDTFDPLAPIKRNISDLNKATIEKDINNRKEKLGTRQVSPVESFFRKLLGEQSSQSEPLSELDKAELKLANLEDAKRLGKFNAFQDDPNRKVSKEELDKLIAQAKKDVEKASPISKTSSEVLKDSLLAKGFGEGSTFSKFTTPDFTNLPEIQLDILNESSDLITKGLLERLEKNSKDFTTKRNRLQKSGELTPEKQQELKETSKAAAEGFFKEANIERLGNSIKRSDVLESQFSKRRNQFDTSTSGGRVENLKDSLDGISEILRNQENTLKLAIDRKEEIVSDSKSSPQAVKESLKEAEGTILQASEKIIETRKKERDAIIALNEATLARTRELRESRVDPGTFQGRQELLNIAKDDLTGRLSNTRKNISVLNKQLETSTNPIEKLNIQSEIENQQITANRSKVGLVQNSKDQQNLVLDQAEATFNANNALKSFKTATEAAKDKMESLRDQLDQSKRALEDFDAETKLRSLGRKGKLLADARSAIRAAKAAGDSTFRAESLAIEAGISPFDLPEDSKGGLRLASDEAFERLKATIRQQDPKRVAEEEGQQRRSLVRNIRSVERDISGLPAEEFQRKFSTLRTLVGAQQQGLNIPGAKDFISGTSKELGINLPELTSLKALETTVPRDVSNISKDVSDILSHISDSNLKSGSKDSTKDSGTDTSSSPMSKKLGKSRTVSQSSPIFSPLAGFAEAPPIFSKTVGSDYEGIRQYEDGAEIPGFSIDGKQVFKNAPLDVVKSISPLAAFPAAFGMAEAPKIYAQKGKNSFDRFEVNPMLAGRIEANLAPPSTYSKKDDVFDQQLFGRKDYGFPTVFEYQKNPNYVRGDRAFGRFPTNAIKAGEIEAQMMMEDIKPLKSPSISKKSVSSKVSESESSKAPTAVKITNPTAPGGASPTGSMDQVVTLLSKILEATKQQPKHTGEEFRRAIDSI